MRYSSFSERLAAIVGNVLDHYDSALFGLLAPLFSTLFFDPRDPLTGLLLTYSMLPLGLLTRPLGALCFGWIGDRWGRKYALFYSLMGMALVTMGIGSLPVYREGGIVAPIGLCLGKMLQSFFAAGETSGGAIFILERTKEGQRGFFSGLYDACSMGGILLASAAVGWFASEEGWRFLYWAGGVTALVGVYLRLRGEPPASLPAPFPFPFLGRRAFVEYRRPLFKIIIASGFSYAIYTFAFTFMNGYLPFITPFTKGEVIRMNTPLLALDLLLLPCLGLLAERWGKDLFMRSAAFAVSIFALPLFSLLPSAPLPVVLGVRSALVLLGVAFAAPYHAWAIEQVPPSHRYTLLSLGYAIGSQCIGAPTAALSLWLYQVTGWGGAPGLYLSLIALLAGGALSFFRPSYRITQEPES